MRLSPVGPKQPAEAPQGPREGHQKGRIGVGDEVEDERGHGLVLTIRWAVRAGPVGYSHAQKEPEEGNRDHVIDMNCHGNQSFTEYVGRQNG